MLDTRGASHYGHGGSRALEEASRAPAKDAIHTLITSNGAPYMNYQTRILMGTYELIRQMPGGEKHVGLTRILHRSKPDILMNAIETFHATPLQPECDGWCEYPVSDRANAVRQFFDAAETNKSMIRVKGGVGGWVECGLPKQGAFLELASRGTTVTASLSHPRRRRLTGSTWRRRTMYL